MTATIDLDESLCRQLKAPAAPRGRKVKDLVADGVRRLIEYRDPAPRTRPEKPFPRLNRKSPNPSKLAADTEFQAEQFRGAGLDLTLL